MSWLLKVHQAKASLAESDADPLREKVETVVRGMKAIGTNALLDLIGLPPTTGNARRISRTMQSLGFVPIKSRRFMPGGWRDTVTRGWARPLRSSTEKPACKVARSEAYLGQHLEGRRAC
jgi:hypothetical protein